MNSDDEPRGPMATSPLQVGLPTRRELAPGHAPLIFDREVLRALAHKLCRYKYTMIFFRVAKPTLNSITRALTFSLPTGAPHTVSTEHDRDSQRRGYITVVFSKSPSSA